MGSTMALKPLVQLFKEVAHQHRQGSTFLQRLPEGHNMDLGFQAGIQAYRAMRASGQVEELMSSNSEGTWFGTICSFLRETGFGWRSTSPSRWDSPQSSVDL